MPSQRIPRLSPLSVSPGAAKQRRPWVPPEQPENNIRQKLYHIWIYSERRSISIVIIATWSGTSGEALFGNMDGSLARQLSYHSFLRCQENGVARISLVCIVLIVAGASINVWCSVGVTMCGVAYGVNWSRFNEYQHLLLHYYIWYDRTRCSRLFHIVHSLPLLPTYSSLRHAEGGNDGDPTTLPLLVEVKHWHAYKTQKIKDVTRVLWANYDRH